MTHARTALLLCLAVTLAGCGSSESGGSSGSRGSDAAGGSADDPAEAAPLQPGTTLLGSVGTPDDPEAFEIALTTQDGAPVETVAAGTYTLVVSDPARTHNFRLTGDGVDVATDVSGTGEERFEVTFAAGEYGYTCDPHPSMSGALRVV